MLEISYKYLNKLDHADYRKYRALKNKKFDGGSALKLLGVLFHVAVASLIGGIASLFTPQWNGWFLFYLIYPLTIALSYGLGAALSEAVGIQKHLADYEKNSWSYKSFQQLRWHFLSLEMEIEEQLKEYNEKGLSELIQIVSRNAGNQDFFDNLVEVFKSNNVFVERATKTLADSSYSREYYRMLRLNRLLDNRGKLIFTRLNEPPAPSRRTTAGGWTHWFRRRAKTPRSGKSSPMTALGDINTNPESNSRASRPNPKVSQAVKNQREAPSAASVAPPKIENSDADWRLTGENEIPEKKAKKSPTVRTIKASEKFWEELGAKKIKIGKKGEMLVMEYERRRIVREYGQLFLSRLVHSSTSEGDGLGYDIASYADGLEIFIEVKTTTGDFWNGLIFTKNELEAMRKLDANYYLYRVFHLDMKSNSGKLKIFKGREAIEKAFDFSPQTFLLEPKA
jgi:hypothetical protein